MNNECLSAVSEAGIKEGADGVWTCKHLHGYSRNYLDNQKGFFFYPLVFVILKRNSVLSVLSLFWKAAVHTDWGSVGLMKTNVLLDPSAHRPDENKPSPHPSSSGSSALLDLLHTIISDLPLCLFRPFNL